MRLRHDVGLDPDVPGCATGELITLGPAFRRLDPRSSDAVLAHELAHVIQQATAQAQNNEKRLAEAKARGWMSNRTEADLAKARQRLAGAHKRVENAETDLARRKADLADAQQRAEANVHEPAVRTLRWLPPKLAAIAEAAQPEVGLPRDGIALGEVARSVLGDVQAERAGVASRLRHDPSYFDAGEERALPIPARTIMKPDPRKQQEVRRTALPRRPQAPPGQGRRETTQGRRTRQSH